MNWLRKILRREKKKRAGFTLVELMIVVIVVGILAAAAIPLYRFALARAYASEAKATIGTIRSAEIVYATEKAGGELPTLPTDYLYTAANFSMATLGVDTRSNTWWHYAETGTGLHADTCTFGCDLAGPTATATEIGIPPLVAGHLYIWVAALDLAVDTKIEGISMAMDIDTGEWHENWAYTP